MRHHRAARAFGVLLVLTIAVGLLDAASAFAITRNQVLARGQVWVDAAVPYSQSAYFQGYRTDCSGFCSMAWGTGRSWTTSTLHGIAYPIPGDQLQPGDAMLNAGSHVRVFYGWLDSSHTQYIAYEQTGPTTICSLHSYAADIGYGYVPYRYNQITDSPAPWNLVLNPTFDVWPEGTVAWWSVSRDVTGTVGVRRRDVAHTSASALGLRNGSTQPTQISKATQTVAVTAGSTYSLSAWALADAAPAAVQLSLQFLSASGATLATTSTAGNEYGVDASAFRQMSRVALAPAGTVQAKVTLALAGNTGARAAGASTAVFDDVYLYVLSPMPVYRFYNFRNGSHFYTASGPERDGVADGMSGTYSYDGIAYAIDVGNPANSTPLWRFFDHATGTHFYTADPAEKATIMATMSSRFQLDGPAYDISSTDVTGSVTVYRFYNRSNGTHFYTADPAEKANVQNTMSGTYSLDGPGFYLAP
jgi:hypothetical protein